jgi:tetratricopeptide (TPR) repeat protein
MKFSFPILATLAATSLFSPSPLLVSPFAMTPAIAQNPVPVTRSAAPTTAPAQQRTEGTVSVVVNGVTSELSLKFQAPDSLRIDVAANPSTLVNAQTLVTQGENTLIFDSSTRRVRRLAYNVAREPWRGSDLLSGGPANIAIFGIIRDYYERYYLIGQRIDNESLNFEARANGPARRVNDMVRTGGDANGMFYAVHKRTVADWPNNLNLTFQAGAVASRIEIGSKETVSSTSTFTIDPATKLPLTATQKDNRKHLVANFKYALKPRAEAFLEGTFSLPAEASDTIVEDTAPKALADYGNPNTAADHFNQGVVLAIHLEDYAAAIEAWRNAAQSAPRATAPHFATYDAALQARNLPRASGALDKLAALLGDKHYEVSIRRANVAGLRRDWPAALTDLDAARQAQPQNLTVPLLRAGILRTRGDIAGARAAWLGILKTDAPAQSSALIAAAEGIAQTATSRAEADVLFAAIPQNTPWEILARTHVAIWHNMEQGRLLPLDQIAHEQALASLASALEREKRDDEALSIWQELAERTFGETYAMVQSRMSLLAARRGDAAASLKAFREVLAETEGEEARGRERALLFEAWRKAFRQSELKSALQNRALAGTAVEEDMETLFAFLEMYGTEDEISSTVRAAVNRYKDSAIWHSRMAEELLAERDALPRTQGNARAALFRDGIASIEKAIELDLSQPYYAMQRALVLLQQATKTELIVDVRTSQANRKRAMEELETLEKNFPGDADVALLLAIGRNALQPRPTRSSVTDISQALMIGTPSGLSRHSTLFFARQGIAMQWQRLDEQREAAREFERLLDASLTSNEETGIAINYLMMMQSNRFEATAAAADAAAQGAAPAAPVDPAQGGIDQPVDDVAAPPATVDTPIVPPVTREELEPQAQLLERLASEPWSLQEQNALMNSIIPIVLRDRTVALPLALHLAQGNASQKVASAHLQFEIDRLLTQLTSAPDAPPSLDRVLREVQDAAEGAANALTDLARENDKLAASRSLVLLAERAASSTAHDEAVLHLRNAIAMEPAESGLRVALADNLIASTRRDDAVAVRDAILRDLPRTSETLQRVAALSIRLAQAEAATRFASQAQSMAQVSRDSTPAQLEIASFVLARALFAAGQTAGAEEIYKSMATPQWATADRVAALLDWQNLLTAAGKMAEAGRLRVELEDLKATDEEIEQAQTLLQTIR